MVSVQANTAPNSHRSSVNVQNRPINAKGTLAPQSVTELPRQDQTRLTPQGKAAGSIGLADPSIDEIRGGHVMVQGAKGPAVKKLQQLLTKAGYPVQVNGSFGPTTEGILKRFQQDHGIEVNGKLGPTTLKKLENPMAETAFGRLLARTGYSKAMSLGGYSSLSKCYTGVGTALEQTGVRMTGLSAYLAADQLARSPRFREVKISANQLPKLPAGAVVVWDRSASPAQRLWGGGWTHGHISIADGKGREMSDYIDAQRTTYYASNRFRVFLPK